MTRSAWTRALDSVAVAAAVANLPKVEGRVHLLKGAKPQAKAPKLSPLEEKMALQIKAAKLPEPEREVCLIPGRRFRWDYVWRAQKVALEVNGGTWVKGGHSSGAGIERDYEKAALAQLHGYKAFSVSARMVKDGTAIKWLRIALEG